ncbi:hypothetical protein DICVIV_03573 [Dictyocaulus viviparus]|uniref:ThiF family protein n=1 Tax=Dictyocaulus viviparus TaxID=29172 RepID=A0A0D8Y0S8_DICVI|nr:hypothetical protein DICVIV_03573 [Dictyocaulus viviparus]
MLLADRCSRDSLRFDQSNAFLILGKEQNSDNVELFKYIETIRRYPGTNGVPCTIDAIDLKQRVVSIVSSSQVENPEAIIAQVPQSAIVEMCRYGAGEIHVIASFIGGIVAQEVIKLATNQYVPLDNTFIYDGHTQLSSVFKM